MKLNHSLACLTIAMCVAILAPSANAGFYDGNELAKLMTQYEKAIKQDRDTEYSDAWKYRAYVIGVCDATLEQYDIPDGIGEKQICAIVAKYLQANPDKWHFSGATIVQLALRKAFPRKE